MAVAVKTASCHPASTKLSQVVMAVSPKLPASNCPLSWFVHEDKHFAFSVIAMELCDMESSVAKYWLEIIWYAS